MKLIYGVSLCKSLSWRIIATLTTVIISYMVTHKVDVALQIGGIEIFAKIIIYYFHERGWELALRKFSLLSSLSKSG
jgi:uncharacterized membrane protein